MTRYVPLWQQGGTYPAQLDRALINTLWPAGGGAGAVPTAVGNTMNVTIPPGTIAVPLQAGQNTALCRWDTNEVVSSTAAPASGNSRIDVVICQVRDPLLDGGANNDFIFLVIAGTPATSNPVAPTVPTNAAEVCRYTVVGGSANLNGVTIIDRRRGSGTVAVFSTVAERDAVTGAGPPDGTQCSIGGVTYIAMGGTWRISGGGLNVATYKSNSNINHTVTAAGFPNGYPITGMTINGLTATGIEMCKIEWMMPLTSTGGLGQIGPQRDGTLIFGPQWSQPNGGYVYGCCYDLPPAGAHNYQLQLYAVGGSTASISGFGWMAITLTNVMNS
jgi:hypothetical protein